MARDYQSNGYKVEKEVHIGGGKAMDLLATKGMEKIAIEIETGNSDVRKNNRKCKEAGFEKVKVIQLNRHRQRR